MVLSPFSTIRRVFGSFRGDSVPQDRQEPDGWDHRLNPGEARRRYHVNPRVPQPVDYNPPGRWQRQRRVSGRSRRMLPSVIDIYALPMGPRPAPSPARAEGSNRRPPLPSGRPPPLIARRPVPISKTDPVYGDRRSPPTITRSPPTMRRSPPAPGLRPQSLPALPRPTRPALRPAR